MENSSNKKQPELIKGGLSVDDRGTLTFANDFTFPGIKRFYMVENFSPEIIRAFHGHQKEAKYVFVVSGSAIVAAVEMDHPIMPNKKNKVHRFVLSSKNPCILFIPEGHANGFRPLEHGTRIIYYSTSSLDESKNDDYRFPHNYWGDDVWVVEHR